MLPVESVRDVVRVLHVADCPVSIVLHCCSENHYLVVLAEDP